MSIMAELNEVLWAIYARRRTNVQVEQIPSRQGMLIFVTAYLSIIPCIVLLPFFGEKTMLGVSLCIATGIISWLPNDHKFVRVFMNIIRWLMLFAVILTIHLLSIN